MNVSQRHYAKWKKPVSNVLFYLFHLYYLEKLILQKENVLVVALQWEWVGEECITTKEWQKGVFCGDGDVLYCSYINLYMC